jgi:hypothetical protein
VIREGGKAIRLSWAGEVGVRPKAQGAQMDFGNEVYGPTQG